MICFDLYDRIVERKAFSMHTAILVGLGWSAVALFGMLMFIIGASLGHRRGLEETRPPSSPSVPTEGRPW